VTNEKVCAPNDWDIGRSDERWFVWRNPGNLVDSLACHSDCVREGSVSGEHSALPDQAIWVSSFERGIKDVIRIFDCPPPLIYSMPIFWGYAHDVIVRMDYHGFPRLVRFNERNPKANLFSRLRYYVINKIWLEIPGQTRRLYRIPHIDGRYQHTCSRSECRFTVRKRSSATTIASMTLPHRTNFAAAIMKIRPRNGRNAGIINQRRRGMQALK